MRANAVRHASLLALGVLAFTAPRRGAGLSRQAGEDRGRLRRRLGVRPDRAHHRRQARRGARSSRSWSRSGPAPAPTSPPSRWCARRRTATRCWSPPRRARSAARSSANFDFDFGADLAPVALIANVPFVLTAYPGLGVKTVQGIHRARQGEAGEPDVRRHPGGNDRPSRRAIVQPARRHQSGDRALSLDRAGDHRPDDRPHLGGVRHRVERAGS